MKGRSVLSLMTAIVLMLGVAGCGGGEETATTTQEQTTETAAEVDPADRADVSVTVNYEGDEPEAQEVYTGGNPECDAENVTKRKIHTNDNGTLQYAVVAVEEGPSGLERETDETPVIDQENCIYTPHVTTVKAGQTLEVTNSDGGLHNVRATKDGTQLFNETTLQDQSFETSFDQTGAVSLVCDVHNWMQGWVYVTDHGRAAVTGENGEATLSDLPPGDYTLTVWQEELGTQTVSVTVEPGENTSASVTFGG